MELTFIDWLIIVGYLAVTLGIGLCFRQRASQGLADYFVSGRSLPWWIAGTSMVATTFAADTPLAVTGFVAKNGLAGNWIWWSLALGGMITVFVYARLWRRAEVLTDVELIELRYSGPSAAGLRGVRALYVALIINPIIIGWVTKAMVTVLTETVLYDAAAPVTAEAAGASVTNWAIIVGLLAIVGVYCTLSGMWGVAMTDFVQFFAAMLGCILLAVVAVEKVGGIEKLQEGLSQLPNGENMMSFLPDGVTDLMKPRAEDSNAEFPQQWMPLNIFLIFLFVQWWATWYPGAEPGGGGYVVQRMSACKDERHALWATLWYQIAHYCIRPWPWLLVAFAAVLLYPDLRSAEDPGAGFAWVIRDVSPVGLRGLMLITFFSAFMSTISTQMNWGASYLVRDVYQRFLAPDASEEQLTRASRISSVFVLILGGIVSGVMIEAGLAIDEAWALLLALGAGTGAVFMLRWFWWRVNAWSEIVAMGGSLLFFVTIPRISEAYPDWLPLPENNRDQVLMFYVAIATIVTWLVATFLTKPTSDETLIEFYRKVRPGGWGWSRIAKQASDVRADRNVSLSFMAAIFGAGIVYFTLPAVGAFIFKRYDDGGLLLCGAAVCVVMVGVLMRAIGAKNIV
ncbi:MAG: Na+:solute symporter [Planctomycetales bacterium]|nr:Na+:solute symporter [Planctomycetales bacterium]